MGVTRKLVYWLAVSVAMQFLPAPSMAQSWSQRAPLNVARQEMAIAELDGRIYAALGSSLPPFGLTSTVEVYDPETDTWTFLASHPSPAHHPAAVGLDGKFYTLGGWAGSFTLPLDEVHAYDPATDRWTRKASMPTARGSPAAAALNGRIYAAGGFGDVREEHDNDFAVYDPATDSWTVLPDMPTGRDHFVLVALDGKLYAIGGRSGVPVLDTVEIYDPTTGLWSTGSPMPTERSALAAATVGGYIVTFGGERELPADPLGLHDVVEAYEPISDSWVTLTPMPTARHGILAGVADDLIYIPGGGDDFFFAPTAVHEVFDPGFDIGFCDDGLDNDGDGRIDFPQDPGCDSLDDGSERDKSVIAVDPPVLEFGAVDVGDASGTMTIDLANLGTDPLVVGAVNKDASPKCDAFEISPPALPAIIPPLGAETVEVVFAPVLAGLHACGLNILGSDPAAPNSQVALRGTGDVATEIRLFLSSAVAAVAPGEDFPYSLELRNTTATAQSFALAILLVPPGGVPDILGFTNLELAAGATAVINQAFPTDPSLASGIYSLAVAALRSGEPPIDLAFQAFAIE